MTPGVADATLNVAKGVVVCATVDVEKYGVPGMEKLFGTGSFHNNDYGLYYLSLRRNAQERVDNFLVRK